LDDWKTASQREQILEGVQKIPTTEEVHNYQIISQNTMVFSIDIMSSTKLLEELVCSFGPASV